MCNFS